MTPTELTRYATTLRIIARRLESSSLTNRTQQARALDHLADEFMAEADTIHEDPPCLASEWGAA